MDRIAPHGSLPKWRAGLEYALNRVHDRPVKERPLLIAGAKGTLGQAFLRLCPDRGIAHVGLSRQELDIADPASVEAALRRYRPWAIINAAGYRHVEEAQEEEERCYRENTAGTALLATVCAREGLPFLTFSSNFVFSGRQTCPYVESDLPTPMSVYGRSKAKAEACVREILPSALIIRPGALFGPWDEANFVTQSMRALAGGQPFIAASDAVVSAAYVPDVVNASLDLLLAGEQGLWHLANEGAITWEQLARRAAERAGIEAHTLEGRPTRAMDLKARRPLYSVLDTERGRMLPPLETALDRYLCECGIEWAALQANQQASQSGRRSSRLRTRGRKVHPALTLRHASGA